jgi:hypothetical protein
VHGGSAANVSLVTVIAYEVVPVDDSGSGELCEVQAAVHPVTSNALNNVTRPGPRDS